MKIKIYLKGSIIYIFNETLSVKWDLKEAPGGMDLWLPEPVSYEEVEDVIKTGIEIQDFPFTTDWFQYTTWEALTRATITKIKEDSFTIEFEVRSTDCDFNPYTLKVTFFFGEKEFSFKMEGKIL